MSWLNIHTTIFHHLCNASRNGMYEYVLLTEIFKKPYIDIIRYDPHLIGCCKFVSMQRVEHRRNARNKHLD